MTATYTTVTAYIFFAYVRKHTGTYIDLTHT